MNRRQALQAFLTSVLQASSVAVVASAALRAEEPAPAAEGNVCDRALALATGQKTPAGEEEFCSFLNGGFRKGGFANGGFRKGGFANGGFANGGFRKGGFANGGFRNF